MNAPGHWLPRRESKLPRRLDPHGFWMLEPGGRIEIIKGFIDFKKEKNFLISGFPLNALYPIKNVVLIVVS